MRLGGAIVGGTQKRQAGNSQAGVVLGLPVHGGAVKGVCIGGLPGGAVVAATDKPPQVDGFLRLVTGGQGQVLDPAQLQAAALGYGTIGHTAGGSFYMQVQSPAADAGQPGHSGAYGRRFYHLGRGLQCLQGQTYHRPQHKGGHQQRSAYQHSGRCRAFLDGPVLCLIAAAGF